MAFLYELTAPNGKSYIGITTLKPKRRWDQHAYLALKNSPLAIHNAIRKYGWESFKKQVLVESSLEYVKELEIKAIKAFNTFSPAGYNLTQGGEGTTGYVFQQKDNFKNSEAVKKTWQQPGYKEKMSLLRKAVWQQPEYKERMRKIHLGVKASEDTKLKMSFSRIGKKHTELSKLKMSLNSSFRRPEVREKIIAANLGKKHSDLSKLKMSLNAATKRFEVKEKLKEACKQRPILTCPFCNKQSTSPAMYHWHFDNCKLKVKV